MALAAIEPQFFAELLACLGLPAELAKSQNDRGQWLSLRAAIGEKVAAMSRAECCALMEGTDACFAPVLSMGAAHWRRRHRPTPATLPRSSCPATARQQPAQRDPRRPAAAPARARSWPDRRIVEDPHHLHLIGRHDHGIDQVYTSACTPRSVAMKDHLTSAMTFPPLVFAAAAMVKGETMAPSCSKVNSPADRRIDRPDDRDIDAEAGRRGSPRPPAARRRTYSWRAISRHAAAAVTIVDEGASPVSVSTPGPLAAIR